MHTLIDLFVWPFKLINKNDKRTHDYLENEIGIDYWVITYSYLSEIIKNRF